jgi:hypothetical protein
VAESIPDEAEDLARETLVAAWRDGVAAKLPTPNPRPVEPAGSEGLPPQK